MHSFNSVYTEKVQSKRILWNDAFNWNRKINILKCSTIIDNVLLYKYYVNLYNNNNYFYWDHGIDPF